MFKVYKTLVHEVQKTTWRSGQKVHAPAQGIRLGLLANTPKNDGMVELQMGAIEADAFVNL